MSQLSGRFRSDAVRATENCDICMRAKFAREPFPLLNRRSDFLFEIVHADLWGPYGQESVRNTRFVLTLVEDYTRHIWTYLISTKDLVCNVLSTFINIVKTHFGKTIRFLRTDNGTEFINKRVGDLCSQHGILH